MGLSVHASKPLCELLPKLTDEEIDAWIRARVPGAGKKDMQSRWWLDLRELVDMAVSPGDYKPGFGQEALSLLECLDRLDVRRELNLSSYYHYLARGLLVVHPGSSTLFQMLSAQERIHGFIDLYQPFMELWDSAKAVTATDLFHQQRLEDQLASSSATESDRSEERSLEEEQSRLISKTRTALAEAFEVLGSTTSAEESDSITTRALASLRDQISQLSGFENDGNDWAIRLMKDVLDDLERHPHTVADVLAGRKTS
jgi:hypothetical protein